MWLPCVVLREVEDLLLTLGACCLRAHLFFQKIHAKRTCSKPVEDGHLAVLHSWFRSLSCSFFYHSLGPDPIHNPVSNPEVKRGKEEKEGNPLAFVPGFNPRPLL